MDNMDYVQACRQTLPWDYFPLARDPGVIRSSNRHFLLRSKIRARYPSEA
jgi:hypothetical protein